MRSGIVLGMERALGAGRVALIKSLIYARKKECTYGAGLPNSAEIVSWYMQYAFLFGISSLLLVIFYLSIELIM